jgi:cytochrome c oxidase cbb3-type subunit 3
MLFLALFLLRLLILAAFLPAMGMAVPASAPDSGQVLRGQTVFLQYCGFCHGPDAAGGAEGPDLMRSALVRHDHGGDLVGALVRDGRQGSKMPPFSLPDTDLSAVAAFLHRRIEQADRASPDRPHDADLKLLLTGNAAAGRSYFDGPGRCNTCHSPSGDLRGIAGRYSAGDLQARLLYPTKVPKTVSIVESGGRHFSGRLLFEDAFSIALLDQDGWYHSWARAGVRVEINDPVAAHLELLSGYTDADIHNLFAYLETLK